MGVTRNHKHVFFLHEHSEQPGQMQSLWARLTLSGRILCQILAGGRMLCSIGRTIISRLGREPNSFHHLTEHVNTCFPHFYA